MDLTIDRLCECVSYSALPSMNLHEQVLQYVRNLLQLQLYLLCVAQTKSSSICHVMAQIVVSTLDAM